MDISELNGKTILIMQASDIDKLAELIADKLPRQEARPALPIHEPPIPQKEAEEFMGVTHPTFLRWRKQGKVTGHTLGGRVYFFKSELLAALQKS